MCLAAGLRPDPLEGGYERSPGPIAVRQTALCMAPGEGMREAKRLENRDEGTVKEGTRGEREGKRIGGEMDVDPLQCQKRIDTAVVV